MEGFFDNYVSSNTLALVVSGIIFVITVALVLRNLISFIITCVLLFFAVVSGLAIANNDIVKGYLHSDKDVAAADTSKTPPTESRIETIRDRLVTIFRQLVETLSNQSKDSDHPDKSRKLRSSIEQVLQELDMHRQKLQNLIDEHTTADAAPQVPPRVSQDVPSA